MPATLAYIFYLANYGAIGAAHFAKSAPHSNHLFLTSISQRGCLQRNGAIFVNNPYLAGAGGGLRKGGRLRCPFLLQDRVQCA